VTRTKKHGNRKVLLATPLRIEKKSLKTGNYM